MAQLQLIIGYYRCHNCQRDVVEHTRKLWQFRVCDECWSAITPQFPQAEPGIWRAENAAQRKKIADFHKWRSEMEARYPEPRSRSRNYRSWRSPAIPTGDADLYYPFCQCGERRVEVTFGSQKGLFGGPFLKYCPTCQAKTEVETVFRMSASIHPDWGDEDWLNLLYISHREAFDVGVLPDYWFDLGSRSKGGIVVR